MERPLLTTNLAQWPVRRGKVRDVYDLGDRLLFIATDRISAFDWILPTGIPDKGRVLTTLSAWWFAQVDVPHHLITTNLDSLADSLDEPTRALLDGRSMIVRKAQVIPFECVVRGYLAGSGWKEYLASASICGHPLPPGLRDGDRLDTPLFTPATKAESGHDENVPIARLIESLGPALTRDLEAHSRQVYSQAATTAREAGLILADTKFEWGLDPQTGDLLLVDEILTPDSSRYWNAATHKPGGPQPSFDKQFVRDWLEASGWDKSSTPPALPDDIVQRTRAKYIECYERLTAQRFPWT